MNLLVFALHLAAAQPAGAAESLQQSSWSAWHGCWQAEGAPASEIVCIAPSAGGVRIATLVDGVVRDESRISADGLARPIRQLACTGTERARWSEDGRRVFLDSDVACERSGRRTVRGMFAFVAPDAWISVQTATEGDSVATRVVRFQAIEGDRLPAAAAAFAVRRVVSDALLDLEETDVAEAVEQIGAAAAQEWMRAAGEPYQLGYQTQDRATSSALEQVGRMSNPVVVREVVRVVERPVYVHNTYITDRYGWYYSPWGYHYHGWRWSHRPLIVVRLPLFIHRNDHYRRDWYPRRDRDRYDNWRNDRDDDGRGGRVTRGGYTSGRERATPNRARTDTRTSAPQATRQTSRPPRTATPQRSSGVTTRATTPRSSGSRTAKARSSRSQD